MSTRSAPHGSEEQSGESPHGGTLRGTPAVSAHPSPSLALASRARGEPGPVNAMHGRDPALAGPSRLSIMPDHGLPAGQSANFNGQAMSHHTRPQGVAPGGANTTPSARMTTAARQAEEQKLLMRLSALRSVHALPAHGGLPSAARAESGARPMDVVHALSAHGGLRPAVPRCAESGASPMDVGHAAAPQPTLEQQRTALALAEARAAQAHAAAVAADAVAMRAQLEEAEAQQLLHKPSPLGAEELERQALAHVANAAGTGREHQCAVQHAHCAQEGARVAHQTAAIATGEQSLAAQRHDAVLRQAVRFIATDHAHKVRPSLAVALEKAAGIPAQVTRYVQPGSVKPVLREPVRWKVNDAATRDVHTFLHDVYAYAVATGTAQSAYMQLADKLAEADMRTAFNEILAAEPQPVSWRDACEVFLHLIGHDIFNPVTDATLRLTRGDVRQEKGQSVLEYGMRMRAAQTSALPLPPLVVCDLFVRGLLPELRHQCMRTENGGMWENLTACIEHAHGKEGLTRRAHAVAAVRGPDRPRGPPQTHTKRPFAHMQRGAPAAAQKGPCTHCRKMGHVAETCWVKNPHLRPAKRSRTDHGGPNNGRGGAASRAH